MELDTLTKIQFLKTIIFFIFYFSLMYFLIKKLGVKNGKEREFRFQNKS